MPVTFLPRYFFFSSFFSSFISSFSSSFFLAGDSSFFSSSTCISSLSLSSSTFSFLQRLPFFSFFSFFSFFFFSPPAIFAPAGTGGLEVALGPTLPPFGHRSSVAIGAFQAWAFCKACRVSAAAGSLASPRGPGWQGRLPVLFFHLIFPVPALGLALPSFFPIPMPPIISTPIPPPFLLILFSFLPFPLTFPSGDISVGWVAGTDPSCQPPLPSGIAGGPLARQPVCPVDI